MKIELKYGNGNGFRETEVKAGASLREIAGSLDPAPEFDILIAKADGYYQDLRFVPEVGSRVELLDMRTGAGEIVYQDSLSFVFCAAVNQVLGKRRVIIANSLNQGFYTMIHGISPVTEEICEKIRGRMQEMIDQDLSIGKETVSSEEAVEILKEEGGFDQTERLIRQRFPDRQVTMYSVDGYRQVSYGRMTASTGVLKYFQLMPYKWGLLLRFPNRYDPVHLPEYREQKKLYQTFARQTKWSRLLDVEYVADLNDIIDNGDFLKLVQLSEALKEKRIAEIADMIRDSGKRIVLIAGPSSSGKTTFARRLMIQLKVNGLDSLYLGTDDYFVERDQTPLDEKGEPNYEGFEAIDHGLFNRDLKALLAGEEVDLPEFDFIKGTKVFGRRITSIDDRDLIVIEGIHGLNEKLTSEIPREDKFKIYISPLTDMNIDEHNRVPTTDERMLRRLVRDYQFRGHDASATLTEWPKVREGEDRNIFPYSDEADVIFNSYHVYEIAVLKKYAMPLLASVGPEDPAYPEANRMLNFLRPFEIQEDDSMIVNNSILREFIGGSIFVS